MFTLLLSTDKKEISALYSAYPDWNVQGFEKPVIAGSAEEAVQLLAGRRFDAVSSLLPLDEGRKLFEVLRTYDTVGMQTARDAAQLHREIAVTRRELLSREKEREQEETEDGLSEIMLHDLLSGLLRGQSYSQEEIENKTGLMQGLLDPDLPIAVSSVRLPEAEQFTQKRWKYGKDRFHNALRNLFERQTDTMNFVMMAVNERHIRLLGYAMKPCTQAEAYLCMLNHISTVRRMVDQFFDMPLVMRRLNSYPDLYHFSTENAGKIAH